MRVWVVFASFLPYRKKDITWDNCVSSADFWRGLRDLISPGVAVDISPHEPATTQGLDYLIIYIFLFSSAYRFLGIKVILCFMMRRN